MTTEAADPCVYEKLRRLIRAVARQHDDALRELGLRGTQFTLMRAALAMAPVSHGELAAAIGMDATTLTRDPTRTMHAYD